LGSAQASLRLRRVGLGHHPQRRARSGAGAWAVGLGTLWLLGALIFSAAPKSSSQPPGPITPAGSTAPLGRPLPAVVSYVSPGPLQLQPISAHGSTPPPPVPAAQTPVPATQVPTTPLPTTPPAPAPQLRALFPAPEPPPVVLGNRMLLPPYMSARVAAQPWVHLLESLRWQPTIALRVVACESSGLIRAQNGNHNGLFQVADGSFDPIANVHEAYALWSSRGWEPWTASEHCWA
jgi:hypothetical protein